MNNIKIKVITKNTIEMFEKEVYDFYDDYSDKYNIEAHYSNMGNQYSVLLIARGK